MKTSLVFFTINTLCLSVPFLYPLKISENLRFSDILKREHWDVKG